MSNAQTAQTFEPGDKVRHAVLEAVWHVEEHNRITRERNYLRPLLTSFDVARIAADNLERIA